MRNVLMLLFAAVFFVACSDGLSDKGRKAYQRYYKETLSDPSSFVLHNEAVNMLSEFEMQYIVDYGARNPLGGMVRKTDTILMTGDIMEVNGVDMGKKYAE